MYEMTTFSRLGTYVNVTYSFPTLKKYMSLLYRTRANSFCDVRVTFLLVKNIHV